MTHWMIGILIALVLLWIGLRRRSRRSPLDVEGKLIWLDKEGSAASFTNDEFYVCGKPDFIYKQKRGILAIEYKSRNGPVFESDIVQAKVAALAARGSRRDRVERILIKTRSTERYVDLPAEDAQLYREVERYVEMVRTAKEGGVLTASPTVPKCRSCGYRTPCADSLA